MIHLRIMVAPCRDLGCVGDESSRGKSLQATITWSLRVSTLYSYLPDSSGGPTLPLLMDTTRSFPKIHPTSPQKITGHPGTSTKCSIASYNKTRHITSHQGCSWKPSRRKGYQRQEKSQRKPLLLLLGIPQEHQATQP